MMSDMRCSNVLFWCSIRWYLSSSIWAFLRFLRRWESPYDAGGAVSTMPDTFFRRFRSVRSFFFCTRACTSLLHTFSERFMVRVGCGCVDDASGHD